MCVYAGWQGALWLHLWYRCGGLPGHVLSAQPNEYDRSLHNLCHQCPGLLPPTHGRTLIWRGSTFLTVSAVKSAASR